MISLNQPETWYIKTWSKQTIIIRFQKQKNNHNSSAISSSGFHWFSESFHQLYDFESAEKKEPKNESPHLDLGNNAWNKYIISSTKQGGFFMSEKWWFTFVFQERFITLNKSKLSLTWNLKHDFPSSGHSSSGKCQWIRFHVSTSFGG